MNKVVFTPAVRINVPLLIGFNGGTGSGKTFTAFEIATGITDAIAPDKKFAVIDTESGRARHYAERFRFDHAELRAPFRPQTYLDAIVSAEEAGYPCVVVDSMSHVWAGDGGVLDWQEEELDRMAGDNWQKREACKMAAWIKPKVAHKKMVQRLLQMRIHVILCFRAEPKVEMVRGEDGKTKIMPKGSLTGLDGWIPICEKSLPFELTASFLLTADKPGVLKPIKLQEQHRPFIPLDRPVARDAGRLLADWANGVVPKPSEDDRPARASDELVAAGDAIAPQGAASLERWWTTSLNKKERVLLKEKIGAWKTAAAAVKPAEPKQENLPV